MLANFFFKLFTKCLNIFGSIFASELHVNLLLNKHVVEIKKQFMKAQAVASGDFEYRSVICLDED